MDSASLQLMFKMFASLAVVLAVFAVLVFVFKKVSFFSTFKKTPSKARSKPIEILSFQSIGPGRSLYLVKCNGRKLLIGSTAQNISILSDMNDELFDDNSFDSSLEERSSDYNETKVKDKFSSQLKEISRV